MPTSGLGSAAFDTYERLVLTNVDGSAITLPMTDSLPAVAVAAGTQAAPTVLTARRSVITSAPGLGITGYVQFSRSGQVIYNVSGATISVLPPAGCSINPNALNLPTPLVNRGNLTTVNTVDAPTVFYTSTGNL